MRTRVWMALAGTLLLMSPAVADVRDGVDAWGRGDYKKAIAEWRPAANAGDADAQFNLAQAYTLGRGVPTDIAVAEGWFRKAALQGHIAAQAKYGLILFDQHKPNDAAPWLEKASLRGEPRAQLVYGTMLFNGDGGAKDWPRAYAFIVRAAAANTPRASEVQAQMDKAIPTDQRQQGLELARRYEAEAQRPELPPEITGKPRSVGMRGTDLPPSDYDPAAPRKPEVMALAPERQPTRAQPPRVRAPAPAPTAQPARSAAPTAQPARARAPAAIATSRGGWKVQLGSFGDPANARKLWGQVGRRFAGADVQYAKSGAMTRVLVGPFASKGAAQAACGSIKPCVPVAP
ncbi:SPOR domain-containing protein [Sphingomonas glacialis]|nr:SPOR domain-containing protein [Sphingomonas glacialis]